MAVSVNLISLKSNKVAGTLDPGCVLHARALTFSIVGLLTPYCTSTCCKQETYFDCVLG